MHFKNSDLNCTYFKTWFKLKKREFLIKKEFNSYKIKLSFSRIKKGDNKIIPLIQMCSKTKII